MNGQIRSRKDGAVQIIEFCNPPMNFISNVMLAELYEELIRIRTDKTVRAIVLTGGMKDSFITHYDVSELLEYSRKAAVRMPGWLNGLVARFMIRLLGAAHMRPWLDRLILKSLSSRSPSERGIYLWARCMHLLDTMPKPLIAAISGLSLGGGCEISLCCDFRFMAKGEHYRIGLPEVLVGIIPGGTGTPLRLPRVVGEAKALEMLMTGKLYTPGEAEEMGLIHKALEPEELMPTVMELAQRLARGAPMAIEAIKKEVREGARMEYGRGRAIDLAVSNSIMATDDAMEGMQKYVDMASEHTTFDLETVLRDASDLLDARVVEFKGK